MPANVRSRELLSQRDPDGRGRLGGGRCASRRRRACRAASHARGRCAAGRSGCRTTAYPSARLAGIAAIFADCGSITAALRALGVADYLRARSTVSCRLPTLQEADALARPPNAPVLVVQFVSVDAQGDPVEAGRSLFAADAVQLRVEHP